jgi:predicted Zn finger-like uncharacterized protein
MSLATRCTSCGTVFRVVQDQLKVSEGWVRCGRCDAVFNALEGLFDLGRDAPPEWRADAAAALAHETPPADDRTALDLDVTIDDASAAAPAAGHAPFAALTPSPTPPPAPSAGSTRGPASAPPSGDDRSPSSSFPSTAPAAFEDLLAADPIDAHLFRKRGPVADVKVDERDRLEFSDARFDSDLFAENSAVDESDPGDAATTDAAALESAHAQPDFLRRAERKARWQRAPVRFALAAAGAAAFAVLLGQVAHHYRDLVAARWPATRPALVAWCRLADCSLEAPRRIDDVAVDSTALTRAIGLDAFVLSVTLKSRSALPLAMPSVDLSLTDGNGRLVARRALAPRDFGTANVIAPGAEAPLQVMLSAGSGRVTGYTVEIFYP